MRGRAIMLATWAGLLAIAGCRSEPPTVTGIPGAGVTTKITGIAHDSTGYTVTFQIANRDTAAIGFGNFCPGNVEVLGDGGWTQVTAQGQCLLSLEVLPGGVITSAAIPRQALTAGTQVRVVFGYDLQSVRGSNRVSTTDPVLVTN